jgi:transposase-like protein
MKLTGVLAAAFLVATSGLSAAAPPLANSDAQARQEKKICRTEKATGSLTRRTRICLTEVQWRELNARTRRGVDEMNGSASGAPRCISAVDVACGAPGAGG